MSLPIRQRPWLLAPDDVLPVELANRRDSDMGDSIAHLGREHLDGDGLEGRHGSIQITRAVCSYRIPTDFLNGATALRFNGAAVGFRVVPHLYRIGVSGVSGLTENWFLDFETIDPLVSVSHHVAISGAPPYSAAIMALLSARKQYEIVGPGDAESCRIWLGGANELASIDGGMLVIHCASSRSG